VIVLASSGVHLAVGTNYERRDTSTTTLSYQGHWFRDHLDASIDPLMSSVAGNEHLFGLDWWSRDD
jgi:hypothetical protein